MMAVFEGRKGTIMAEVMPVERSGRAGELEERHESAQKSSPAAAPPWLGSGPVAVAAQDGGEDGDHQQGQDPSH